MIDHSQSQEPRRLEDHSHDSPPGLELIRGQLAIVRALTDEVERVVPCSWAEHPLSAQLIEEMTSLGHRILEIASALAGARDRQSSSVASLR